MDQPTDGFDLWKTELESRLAEHLFVNPEKIYVSFKEGFHLSQKLSDYFTKWGFRPARVEDAFGEFYAIAFEGEDPMESYQLNEEDVGILISHCESRHQAGLFGLLTAEGWMRSYLTCISLGRLRKTESV